MPRTVNQAATQEVHNQISTFVAAGESFTSLHVTNALRAAQTFAGTYGHVNGIAPIVRSAYDNGNSIFSGYTRTTLYLNNNEVFVYHPSGDDPRTIQGQLTATPLPRVDLSIFRDGNGVVQQPQTPAPITIQAPVTVPTAREKYSGGKDAQDGDEVQVSFNGDGDAQLPRAMTRALGLNNGDGVAVEGQSLGGSVTLRAAGPNDTIFANLQRANGALRLRDSRLMPWGVGNGDNIAVKLDTAAKTLTIRDI